MYEVECPYCGKEVDINHDDGYGRVDIFARQRREGWDAWGNEVVSNPLFKQGGV